MAVGVLVLIQLKLNNRNSLTVSTLKKLDKAPLELLITVCLSSVGSLPTTAGGWNVKILIVTNKTHG